jgi:outer membrane lipoprotein SlyB
MKKIISKLTITAVATAMLLTTSCSNVGLNDSANVYRSGQQTMTAARIQKGRIDSIRQVRIQGEQTGIGNLAGTATGAILAGNRTKNSRGGLIAGIAGGAVGAMIGNAIENKISSADGYEIAVQLDNGELISIVQTKEDVLAVNDRVRVLEQQGKYRVVLDSRGYN